VTPQTLQWLAALAALAALPLLLVVVTSFVKIAVVLGILRNALGIPGVPPAAVMMGVTVVLTAFIMAPVGLAMVQAGEQALAEAPPEAPPPPDGAPAPPGGALNEGTASWDQISAVAAATVEPLRAFLSSHAHPDETALFVDLSRHGGSTEAMAADDLLVLAPAFVVSELREAFEIGFLLFVPFLVLDLVVANILLGLGMPMLSPTAVSLPFKLLLFVVVDGWTLIAQGLVASYQGPS
jgi:type III secretion protein R